LENNSSRKLIEYIKQKPQIYEASSSAFWDDENISGYMLEAHLDPDAEGATRKHEFIQRSADWIAAGEERERSFWTWDADRDSMQSCLMTGDFR